MRNNTVKLFIAQTLDGYIASLDGNIDWLINLPQPQQDDSYDKFIKDIDVVIMGSKTYLQVTTELSIDSYPYAEKQSIVLTTQDLPARENVDFVNQNIVTLLDDPYLANKNIWIIGGTSLITPLVEANLIDEYIITIVPLLLGSGIPLFGNQPNTVNLKLQDVYKINGFAYLTYHPIRP